MPIYNLLLKSPFGNDYESSIKAENKEEAIEYFFNDLGKYGWSRKEVEQHIAEE